MKKGICSLILIFSFIISTCFAAVQFNTEEVGIVKVCGIAKILGNDEVAKTKAIEDAKRKAVGKAASRFISSKESRFQPIVSNYKKYVVAKGIKVARKQKVNGKYLIFCDVAVNFAMIDKDIRSVGEKKQDENFLDEAVFLVRIVGLDDKELGKTLPMNVLVDYQHAFREMGFSTNSGNVSENAVKNMLASVNSIDKNSMNYSSYRSAMLKDLQEDVEITLAVLGEIRVTKISDLGSQVYAEVDCVVESLELSDKGVVVIGSHKEQFNATRPDKKTALSFAIQKAAVNTSKNLATMTLNYWKTSKR